MVCNSVVVKLVGGISRTDCNSLLYRLEFLLLRPFLPPRSTGNADADADADADSDIEAEDDGEVDDGFGSIIDFYRPADLTPDEEKGGCASAGAAPVGAWAWVCGLLVLVRRRTR